MVGRKNYRISSMVANSTVSRRLDEPSFEWPETGAHGIIIPGQTNAKDGQKNHKDLCGVTIRKRMVRKVK